MKNNTLAIALASLLVGGVAVAAFQNNRDDAGSRDVAAASTMPASSTSTRSPKRKNCSPP